MTNKSNTNLPTQLPGEQNNKNLIKRMIRVDHAGEYGAVQIYKGQLSILKNTPSAPIIEEMAKQERVHLKKFEELINEKKVRPTALLPLWHFTGFALGAATALLGEKAAMACTVAVEEVIDEHYSSQVLALGDGNEDLKNTFETFRLEELEHKETSLQLGAEETPGYKAITSVIKTSSRIAIWLSERI